MNKHRKIVLLGQLIFIIAIGFTVDKAFRVLRKPVIHKEIIPYTSTVNVNPVLSKTVAYAEIPTYEAKKAEDVWVNQDGKFLQAEDRFTNTELALMMLNGESYKAEKIIKADQYDKNAVDREKRKIEAERKKVEKEKIIIASNGSAGGQEIIKALPHDTFKSYMAWTALAANTPQGRLSAKAIKDTETAIMTYEGRYLVALGFAYSNQIGEKIDVVMEDGRIIPVIVGDWKATKDTINNSTHKVDGSIIEFIVNSNKEAALDIGTSGNYDKLFPGKIKEFRKRV